MRLCCISDVHEQWHTLKIPECDLLISAGDYSYRGKPDIVRTFHEWMAKQPAKHFISVQGNHELWVEKNFKIARGMVDNKIHFVENATLEIEGHKIFCSAVQPEFGNWAYGKKRGKEIAAHWALIPDDTEILVTHGPPYGILDQAVLGKWNKRISDSRTPLGCQDLRKRIKHLKKLKVHIFGHIHASSGVKNVGGVHFINASICDESYKPANPPRIFEVFPEDRQS